MSSFRHPLLATYGERAVADNKDPKLKNCLVEFEQVGEKETEAWVQKRPGLKAYDDLSVATSDVGRGCYTWQGEVYAVIGDELFADESDLGQIETSSGRVYFDQAADGTGLLVFHDGATLYTVTESGTIAEYRQDHGDGGLSDVENLPAAMLPGIVVLDQYCFLGSNDVENEIHNSNVGDVTLWTAGDFVVGELRSDPGVAIARYYNYIVALNEQTTEYFLDAGNSPGTPLDRYDGVLELQGAPAGSGGCVVNADDKLIWVAQSPTSGRFVAMLDKSLKSKRVSTTAIDEYLEAEDTNISNAYAYHIRIAGSNLYVLTLKTTAAKTFVLDLDKGIWMQWSSDVSDTESYFTVVDTCEKGGKVLGLDEDNGFIFELDPETYQDNNGVAAQTIKVEIHTKRFDDGVQLNKFCHRLYPVCDFVATGTADLLVAWSDDDYATFTTNRTLDLTSTKVFLTRCGTYRRRSYRLQFQSNNPLRIMALDGDNSHGYYGR